MSTAGRVTSARDRASSDVCPASQSACMSSPRDIRKKKLSKKNKQEQSSHSFFMENSKHRASAQNLSRPGSAVSRRLSAASGGLFSRAMKSAYVL